LPLHLHLLLPLPFFAAALANPKQLPMSAVTGKHTFPNSVHLEQRCCNAGSVQYLQRSLPQMALAALATADSSMFLWGCILDGVALRGSAN